MRRVLIRLLLAGALLTATASAGYVVSTQLGRGLLRSESERQLSRLLRGPVQIDHVRLLLRLGLRLEGEGVRAYPRSAGGGWALAARRVDAEIDLLSLLLGRFRLAELRVTDARFDIERDAAGRWSPYPIAALAARESPLAPDDPERKLGWLKGLERVTRYLLDAPRVAARVELRNGRVHLTDHAPVPQKAPPGPKGPAPLPAGPVAMQLESIYGSWDHRWLSGDPELRVDAVFVSPLGSRAPLEIEGWRRRDSRRQLDVAVTGGDLLSLAPYLKRFGPGTELAGTLSGGVVFETREPGSGTVEVDWIVEDLLAAWPRRGAQARVESERAMVGALLELHPHRLRVARGRLAGPHLSAEVSGAIERPLRDSSPARLRAEVRGVSLDDVRRFVDSLPPADGQPLTALLSRVTDGRIARIGGSGSTHLGEWRRLFGGELGVLPNGFLISLEAEALDISAGADDAIRDLRGVAEWSGDRIALRDVRARWNEEELPRADFVIEGVSHLFDGPDSERRLLPGARALPGIDALLEAYDGWSRRDAGEEGAGFPALDIELDALHHPALRWPFTRANLHIERLADGFQVDVRRGRLASAETEGELVFVRTPEPRVSATLRATGPTEMRGAVALEPGVWAKGRVRLAPIASGPLAYESLESHFALLGSRLILTDVRGALAPRGALRASAGIELGDPQAPPLELSLELEGGELERLAGIAGIPPGVLSGSLDLVGSLAGEILPGRPPLAGLSGFIRAHTADGEIRRKVPIMVAMAQATEGFNPFAARDTISYETIDATLELERGRVSTEALTLEGPMRVFASGELDASLAPPEIDAVVGVFLFRQADLVLGKLPLIGNLISDKGLVGAYFSLTGTASDPEVRTLPGRTLAEGMPEVVKAPFKILQFLVSPRRDGD